MLQGWRQGGLWCKEGEQIQVQYNRHEEYILNSSTYHNFRKTVLVTGGSGFVAHHVIETILDNTDWDVVSLDRSEDTFTFNYAFLLLIKY